MADGSGILGVGKSGVEEVGDADRQIVEIGISDLSARFQDNEENSLAYNTPQIIQLGNHVLSEETVIILKRNHVTWLDHPHRVGQRSLLEILAFPRACTRSVKLRSEIVRPLRAPIY